MSHGYISIEEREIIAFMSPCLSFPSGHWTLDWFPYLDTHSICARNSFVRSFRGLLNMS
ncbi:hypothetical protein BMS3Abin14_01780 [bacterium BMS3Abin14]|nr:hypothetical protein BMS3Abin14_01780 [bacterium BMS3Abin14]